MFDLMLVAYQADLTRVCTFLVGREKSVRPYPEIGIAEAHHAVSHHQMRADLLERLSKINTHHMELFARFLEKMKATPEGDGTLLDNSLIIYGAGMSNSNAHTPRDLPIAVVGGGGGLVRGGRHLQMPAGVPLANLHLTILDKMGVPVDHLGNSNGELKMLSEV
jgi:hypothetical protein